MPAAADCAEGRGWDELYKRADGATYANVSGAVLRGESHERRPGGHVGVGKAACWP